MEEHEAINNRILELWTNHVIPKKGVRIPLLYSPIIKNTLLVVELNPSFDHDAVRQIFDQQNWGNSNINRLYRWTGWNSPGFEWAEREHLLGPRKYGKYFGRINEVLEQLKINTERIYHLALYPYRSSEYEDVEELFAEGGKYHAMKEPLMDIAAGIIRKAEPKIILVADDRASMTFINELGRELDLDPDSESPSPETGFHTVTVNNKKVPIFFSGMITDRGGVDKFSRERLVFLMKKALGGMSMGRDGLAAG